MIRKEKDMTINNINADEVVETVARMTKEERKQFVKTMVSKWSNMAQDISNAIDQEVYDNKHYG